MYIRQLVFAIFFFTILPISAQKLNQEKVAILEVMKQQEAAWTAHNIEGFMQGYWKSDSLKFFGSNGITYGWNQTLERYKKSYPSDEAMGKLKFTIEDMSPISDGSYWVMGRYHLSRKVGDAQGIFMIIFKKINGEWKIVADMSC